MWNWPLHHPPDSCTRQHKAVFCSVKLLLVFAGTQARDYYPANNSKSFHRPEVLSVGSFFSPSTSLTPFPPDHPQVLRSVLTARTVHLSLDPFPTSGSGSSLHIFCIEADIKGGLGRAANAEIKAFVLMGITLPQKCFFSLSASCTTCTDTHSTYTV